MSSTIQTNERDEAAVKESIVVIAVPTYHRPAQLRAGLPAILKQALAIADRPAASFRAEVLVIDNDAAGSARPIVDAVNSPLISYVNEAHPGISAARNRALHEAAHADLLVFIDDDEKPEAGWLDALIHTWLDTRATAVAGPVISTFAHTLEPWVESGTFFNRRRWPTGTQLSIAATNNLLLDMRQIGKLNLAFDERLGLSGGEDSLFTRQLIRDGGRIVWCDESVVLDPVPAERTTRRWLMNRAWSQGNTVSVVAAHLAQTRFQAALVAAQSVLSGLIRIAGGSVRIAWGWLSRSLRHRALGLRSVYRGGGMIAGVLGHLFLEYDRATA